MKIYLDLFKRITKGLVPLGFILLSLLLITSCGQQDGNYSYTEEEGADSTEQIVNIRYGLPADSFNIHTGTIKPNQFLADILLKYHVSYPEIDRLVKKAKETFDVRYMKSGRSYAVFCDKDSLGKAKCFIYEPNAEEYIVFDLRDSINVYKGVKPVEIRENVSYGTINSSLYQTLTDIGASPALAMEMADIYAWTIDFYRIQKGDNFKVIYTEKYVDGKRIGIHEIKACLFNHFGNDFYAFGFEQDGFKDYFDLEANSLRKAFFQSPLKFGRMTSSYTLKRFHPVQKRWKAHLGTDYAAPTGTPIMATGDGIVIEARYKQYNGNYVKIKHNGTYTTQYLHMSKIANGIKPGIKVRQGQTIGYVGSTGLATGPHVCYRFWKNGSQVNHRAEKLPPSNPVKKENQAAFYEYIKPVQQRLDSIGDLKIPS